MSDDPEYKPDPRLAESSKNKVDDIKQESEEKEE